MRLLLTHGGDSDSRVERGLKPHGIECVKFETTGRLYNLSEEVSADVGLVYPSRLAEGGVVDALGDLAWVNGPREVLTTRNKARTTTLLESAGVPVPETRLVSNPVGDEVVERAFEDIGPPAVVKPNSASAGRGATLVHDADSATGVADIFGIVHESSLVEDRSFVVQEYVEGARDYRVMVLEGEYAGAVERRADGWKKNVHAGAEAVGVKPPDEVVSLAEEAARVLDVPFCGVDMLDAGEVVVNEVNARPTVDDAEKYEEGFYASLARLAERHSEKKTG